MKVLDFFSKSRFKPCEDQKKDFGTLVASYKTYSSKDIGRSLLTDEEKAIRKFRLSYLTLKRI